jgi:hypothetical protein
MATVEAEPNISQSNSLPPDERPVRPVNSLNSSGACSQTRQIRQHQQHQPDRLRPQLDSTDQRHAVDHQRNHHHRAQQVAPAQRQAEVHLYRQRHDGRLDGEEDEGEARVDERSDGRAEIAEAGATRQQVHVEAVSGRAVADGKSGEEGDQADEQNGPQRVGETVVQRNRAADGFERQEGHGAECGICHAPFRPLAEAARRVAQRVVLERFRRDPGVVVAANLENLLGGF